MCDIEIVFFDGSARKVGAVENYWVAAGFLRVNQPGSAMKLFPLCNVREIEVLERVEP